MRNNSTLLPPCRQTSFGSVKPLSRMVWDHRAPCPFDADELPDEDVQTILTLAAQAPSAFNLQPWRFVVVRKPEQRDRLQRCARGPAHIADAPVVVVAYGRREAWDEHAGEIFVENESGNAAAAAQHRAAVNFVGRQPIAVWLNRHVMVAFTYMMVAAEALGWNTAPMECFDSAAVCDVLGLPADAEVIAMLAIGRQHEDERGPPQRLPLEKLVCAERFGVAWSDPAEAAL